MSKFTEPKIQDGFFWQGIAKMTVQLQRPIQLERKALDTMNSWAVTTYRVHVAGLANRYQSKITERFPLLVNTKSYQSFLGS